MLNSRAVTANIAAAQCALAKRINAENVGPVDCEVEVGAHPEGRKRGGTVSVLVAADNTNVRVYYDEVAEEWVGYDNEDDD